jgi:hypothetical protein
MEYQSSYFLLSPTPVNLSSITSKKPSKTSPNRKLPLAAGTVSHIKRSHQNLIVENAILRQQLIVLNRQIKRPKFTNGNRLRLVLLSRLTQFWESALRLIQPMHFFDSGHNSSTISLIIV